MVMLQSPYSDRDMETSQLVSVALLLITGRTGLRLSTWSSLLFRLSSPHWSLLSRRYLTYTPARLKGIRIIHLACCIGVTSYLCLRFTRIQLLRLLYLVYLGLKLSSCYLFSWVYRSARPYQTYNPFWIPAQLLVNCAIDLMVCIDNLIFS